jgi:TRAP-type C4-dicarboxylate transport system permease large subunit
LSSQCAVILYQCLSLDLDDLLAIAKAAFPFFLLMLLATVLITVFPEIVLFLPNKMK